MWSEFGKRRHLNATTKKNGKKVENVLLQLTLSGLRLSLPTLSLSLLYCHYWNYYHLVYVYVFKSYRFHCLFHGITMLSYALEMFLFYLYFILKVLIINKIFSALRNFRHLYDLNIFLFYYSKVWVIFSNNSFHWWSF